MASIDVILVRHARPKASGVCYGRAEVEVAWPDDAALSRLRGALGPEPIERLSSSPSRRCRTLSAALDEGRGGVPIVSDERRLELDFGAWEGKRWDAIHREDPSALADWATAYASVAPPGGESVANLEARVGAFVASLEPCRRHVVVTHAGVIRCLWVLAGLRTWPEALEVPVPHLEPLLVSIDRGAKKRSPRVRRL
jgi:alpha-ribazole phosphatase